MSYWTYLNGTITVEPMGRTQAEKRYILDTVLSHLPRVTGSEGDMNVYVIQKNGYNCSKSHDEFGQTTDNLVDNYGYRNRHYGWLRIQDQYILVVDASLRDREFDQTFREFMKWICRLAKRVTVNDVLVEINGQGKAEIIKNKNLNSRKYSWKTVYDEMFEPPTWSKKNVDNEPNWCEFLLWDKARDSDFPIMLEYKYYNSIANDKEVERRLKYQAGD